MQLYKDNVTSHPVPSREHPPDKATGDGAPVEMSEIDLENFNKKSLGVGGGKMDPGVRNYKDMRGFVPMINFNVKDRTASIRKGKWAARVALLLILLGVLIMIAVMMFTREQQGVTSLAAEGSFNSTVMYTAFEGTVEFWNDAFFVEAAAEVTGVGSEGFLIWEVWGSAAPAVHLYFQISGLSTQNTVDIAVSRLSSALLRDFTERDQQPAATSPFRNFGLTAVSVLYIDIDLSGVKPPSDPIPPPPMEIPTPEHPPTTTLPIAPPQQPPKLINCSGYLTDDSVCGVGLVVDPRTSRCRCPYSPLKRLVCVDFNCVVPVWRCNVVENYYGCGVSLLECKSRCEAEGFCIGVLHDTRRPGNFSCELLFREGLSLPWGVAQQKEFSTHCELSARFVPKNITVSNFPRVQFNETGVSSVNVTSLPEKGNLVITPTAMGVTFTPTKVVFTPNDTILRQKITFVADEVLENTTIFTASTSGTKLHAGGYLLHVNYLRQGPASGEYNSIQPSEIVFSDPGRVWVSVSSDTTVVEGQVTLWVVRLSEPLNYSIIVRAVVDVEGIRVFPEEIELEAGDLEGTMSCFGVGEGGYTVNITLNNSTEIDAPTPFNVKVSKFNRNGVRNIAPLGLTSISSRPRSCPTSCVSSAAVDGVKSTDGDVAMTSFDYPIDTAPWWAVDFTRPYAIYSLIIYNRKDCCRHRLADITYAMLLNGTEVYKSTVLNELNTWNSPETIKTFHDPVVISDRVVIYKTVRSGENGMDAVLNLLEVEIMTPEVAGGVGEVEQPVEPGIPEEFSPNAPPFEPGEDQRMWNVAWLGVVNQSSVAGGCPDCGAATVINHQICPKPGGVEYSMTESMVPNQDRAPWLSITLPTATYIHSVKLFNRYDCCKQRMRDITVTLSFGSSSLWVSPKLNPGNALLSPDSLTALPSTPIFATTVNITKANSASITNIDMVLSVAEVEIYSYDPMEAQAAAALRTATVTYSETVTMS